MLAYKNEQSGMLLALVEAPGTPEGSRWLLIDSDLQDRFASKGGGILPGSGPKWSHLHRHSAEPSGQTENRPAEQEPDSKNADWDEYPWQVVGIMGEQMLNNLRNHILFREATIRKSLQGLGLPGPAPGSPEAAWQEGSNRLFRVSDPLGVALYSLPRTNATQIGRMSAGEYVRGSLVRNSWVQLEDRQRWGKQPCWAMALGPNLEQRLEAVAEEEVAGFGLSLEHEGPSVEMLDRPLAPALAAPDLAALPSGTGQEDSQGVQALRKEDRQQPQQQQQEQEQQQDVLQAPHEVVLSGALGSRAAEAARLALSDGSVTQVERGLAALRALLAEELRRETGPRSASQNSHAALRLHLTLVRALLKSTREKDALQEAAAAATFHPTAAAALLWLARCRLRHGSREAAFAALEAAVEAGTTDTAESQWGYSDALGQLFAARKTERLRREAEAAYMEGDFGTAASCYMEAIEASGAMVEDTWGRAMLLADRAVCLRRLRDLTGALKDLDASLSLVPRYKRAIFRRGLVLLQASRPQDAIAAFEGLLRLDRKWPKLIDWLVRAHMFLRRAQRSAGAAVGTCEDELAENYYDLLGIAVDFTQEELKHAFRKASLKYHPDKPSGSQRAFQRAANAFETLLDPDKRQKYNEGADLNNIFEELERRYFPERYQFLPFGDPFEQKRVLQAMNRQQRHFTQQSWQE
ncbi:unnamed protein product [Polarella glacialis]|nr:unnamed protein product [Polarella glacialis]